MYEMEARQYDPAIARWVVIDPVVHHSMSPYNAFDNNPVYWADPSGANVILTENGTGFTGDDATTFYNALLGWLDNGYGEYTVQGEVVDASTQNASQEGAGTSPSFSTELDAVVAFALKWNLHSIKINKELMTVVYSAKVGDVRKYGYLDPYTATSAVVFTDDAGADLLPKLAIIKKMYTEVKEEADVHTHSSAFDPAGREQKALWDRFSDEDLANARNSADNKNFFNKPMKNYLVTPWGNIFFFDPYNNLGSISKGGVTKCYYHFPVYTGAPKDPKLKNKK